MPRDAEEAVDRFMRCKLRGLKAYLVPECLIACSQSLSPEEMEKFETWIVNPQQDLHDVDLVEAKELRAANDLIFAENLKRIEDQLDGTPPLPALEEEKVPDLTQRVNSLALEPQSCMATPSDRCSTPSASSHSPDRSA